MPATRTHEIGVVIAGDDPVAIHGRSTGWGPTPLIVVDIYRVENSMLAGHWDVRHTEVSGTTSGKPMCEAAQ